MCERFYCEEHMNASSTLRWLHIFHRRWQREKEDRGARKGCSEGWQRIVTAVKEGVRERNMSCSLYLRRSHVISAVIGLGYRYVCIMPRQYLVGAPVCILRGFSPCALACSETDVTTETASLGHASRLVRATLVAFRDPSAKKYQRCSRSRVNNRYSLIGATGARECGRLNATSGSALQVLTPSRGESERILRDISYAYLIYI